MSWQSYVVVAISLCVVGGVGGKATTIGPWYRNLNKPTWNPPDWAFPVVWTSIYILIIASIGRAWNLAESEVRVWLIVATAINFFLNMIWSVLFFALRRPRWAFVEVLFLWFSIVLLIGVVGSIDNFSAVLLLPYLIWVSIATYLNLCILRLNPELG